MATPSTSQESNMELVKLSTEKYKYTNGTFKKVSAKMYDYNCDVKLKVDKETFRVHRHVLSEASDYFAAMFSIDMRESQQEAVELQEVSACGFAAMLEYFYHGHVTLSPNNCDDVLEAARFFHIKWLLEASRDYLMRYLALVDYEHVQELADHYVLGDLKSECLQQAGSDARGLFSDLQMVKRLSYDFLYELLAEGEHFVDANEGILLDALLAWGKQEKEARKDQQMQLLRCLRYSLMKPEEIEDLPEFMMEDEVIAELIEEAREYHGNPSGQCLMASPWTEARGSKDMLMLISAVDDADLFQYKVPNKEGLYSEDTNTNFMHSVFEFASVTMHGNFLFIAGGYDRQMWCSSPTAYRYDPSTRAWGQLASMRQPRVSFALCTTDSGLYAVGGIEHTIEEGRDTEIILSSAEFYNPASGTWTLLRGMPVGCFSAAAAVIDEKLYVSGGINDDPEDTIPVKQLRMYHPDENAWRDRQPMNVERQGHSMTTVGTRLYVFGGYTSSNDTMSFDHSRSSEMYDEETGQWTMLEDMPSCYEHLYSAAAELNGIIYIVGSKIDPENMHSSNRCIAAFNCDSEKMSDGEECDPNVQKIVAIRIPIPQEGN